MPLLNELDFEELAEALIRSFRFAAVVSLPDEEEQRCSWEPDPQELAEWIEAWINAEDE